MRLFAHPILRQNRLVGVGMAAVLATLLTLPTLARPDDPERFPRHARPVPGTGGSVLSGALLNADADVLALHDHVVALASPFFEGRGIGTHGNEVAGDYVRFFFDRIGLEPLFKSTPDSDSGEYFQQVNVEGEAELRSAQARVIADDAGLAGALAIGEQFNALGFSGGGGEGRARGPMSFVGYSIARGPEGYRSYAFDDDLTGRIAVVLRFEPFNSKGKSLWSTGQTRWSRRAGLLGKIDEAIDHGAAAVVVVNPPGADDFRVDMLLSMGETSYGPTFPVPVVAIDGEVMDRLVRASDPEQRSLEQLTAIANAEARHKVIHLDPTVQLDIAVEIGRKQILSRNVGGFLPGRGALASEFVIIGAHYDHLGYGELGGTRHRTAGQIHPGADDNASGTAGLILLAKRLTARYRDADAPDDLRSVVFAALTAEEVGLVGSQQFVRDPPIDLSRAAVMINLDMIGRIRNRTITVSGLGTAEQFGDLLDPIFEGSPLRVRTRSDGVGPSDHTSFHEAGLPVLHFFSGLHDDYHTPGDTAQWLNFEGAVQALGLIEQIVLKLATAPERPRFVWTGTGSWTPVRLGITIGDGSGPGVLVEGVERGSAADEAGIRSGDSLVSWADVALVQASDLIRELKSQAPGDRVDVVVRRGDQRVQLSVLLRGRLE